MNDIAFYFSSKNQLYGGDIRLIPATGVNRANLNISSEDVISMRMSRIGLYFANLNSDPVYGISLRPSAGRFTLSHKNHTEAFIREDFDYLTEEEQAHDAFFQFNNYCTERYQKGLIRKIWEDLTESQKETLRPLFANHYSGTLLPEDGPFDDIVQTVDFLERMAFGRYLLDRFVSYSGQRQSLFGIMNYQVYHNLNRVLETDLPSIDDSNLRPLETLRANNIGSLPAQSYQSLVIEYDMLLHPLFKLDMMALEISYNGGKSRPMVLVFDGTGIGVEDKIQGYTQKLMSSDLMPEYINRFAPKRFRYLTATAAEGLTSFDIHAGGLLPRTFLFGSDQPTDYDADLVYTGDIHNVRPQAYGGDLDQWGFLFGINRKPFENDEDYRSRLRLMIMADSTQHGLEKALTDFLNLSPTYGGVYEFKAKILHSHNDCFNLKHFSATLRGKSSFHHGLMVQIDYRTKEGIMPRKINEHAITRQVREVLDLIVASGIRIYKIKWRFRE